MRIVLVSLPVRTHKPAQIPPIGIMSLAAHLLALGHEVKIVDAARVREPDEKVARRVADFAPHLIGLGGIVTIYGYAVRLSAVLRKINPGVPIVLGGQILINNAENCFRHMAIDYAIHGYGEIALGKLVDHVAGKLSVEEIPGLSYRRDGAVATNPGREFFRHMDDMPYPAYHLVDMDYYSTRAEAALPHRRTARTEDGVPVAGMFVMGTLGCTDRCTFCVHEQEFVGLKRHSTEHCVRHLEMLRREYGIRYFIMGEEMFLANLRGAREFNRVMRERLPDCFWGASTRANVVTPELIEELSDGNCVGLHWGYESGSQRILDIMLKRMSVEVNERAYRLSKKANLLGSLSFMVGNVGETNRTIKETIGSIHRAGISEGTVFHVSAYPGGRLWDWAVERGFIGDTHAYLLEVSDVEPAGHVNINLTPYAEWVLRAWKKMVSRAIYEQTLAQLPDGAPEKRHGALWYLRGFFTKRVLPAVVDAYMVYHRLRKRLLKTKRDRMAEFNVDAKGALLPDNLFVARPQRHQSPEQLLTLRSAARDAVPLGQATPRALDRKVEEAREPVSVRT